jgi:hypothetical protein
MSEEWEMHHPRPWSEDQRLQYRQRFRRREEFTHAKELMGIKGVRTRRCDQLLKPTGHAFWQVESWDRIVSDTSELRAFRKYIATNPEKAWLRDDEYTLENYNAPETYE